MNRRKAIGGILALTGIGIATYTGFHFFYAKSNRGQLPNYKNLIAALVDVIIPATNTPGAKEANVKDFIISYMESCSSKKEYTNFFNGLNDLQETCLDTYGFSFEKCTPQEQIAIVKDLDSTYEASGLFSKIRNKISGRPFYTILKALTVEGYCTSELGATKHLVYEPIPARYKAITTIQPNQKAWATK